jgi:hypothetical protein
MFSTDEYSAGLARGRVNVARERLIAYAEERSIMDAVAFLTDRLARATGTGARFACCATCSRSHAIVRQTAASSSCRRRVGPSQGAPGRCQRWPPGRLGTCSPRLFTAGQDTAATVRQRSGTQHRSDSGLPHDSVVDALSAPIFATSCRSCATDVWSALLAT